MPIKVVFLDCDGTLTTAKSSWEYLHRRLDLWTENADAYQRLFRAGEIDYYEFCHRDALLWKGLSAPKVSEVVREIPYQEGAGEAVALLKRLGALTIIVSSGLSVLVNRVKEDLGIDMAFSNELVSRAGHLTGEVKINVEYGRKGLLVKEVLHDLGLEAQQASAIGDGDGDGGMFEAVALPLHLCTNGRADSGRRNLTIRTFSEAVSVIRNYV